MHFESEKKIAEVLDRRAVLIVHFMSIRQLIMSIRLLLMMICSFFTLLDDLLKFSNASDDDLLKFSLFRPLELFFKIFCFRTFGRDANVGFWLSIPAW